MTSLWFHLPVLWPQIHLNVTVPNITSESNDGTLLAKPQSFLKILRVIKKHLLVYLWAPSSYSPIHPSSILSFIHFCFSIFSSNSLSSHPYIFPFILSSYLFLLFSCLSSHQSILIYPPPHFLSSGLFGLPWMHMCMHSFTQPPSHVPIHSHPYPPTQFSILLSVYWPIFISPFIYFFI